MHTKALLTTALFLTVTAGSVLAAPANDSKTGQAAPAQDMAPETVAAIISGRPIKISEIDAELNRPEMAAFYGSANKDPKMLTQLRASILNSMINKELLLTEAKASTAVKEPDVQKSVDTFVAQQGGKERIMPLLQQRGVTWDHFVNEVKEGMRVQAYVENDLAKNVKVSDAELKKIFDADPSRFGKPETVHARHILIAVPAAAKPEEADAAKKKIDGLYAEAAKPGADFAKLAAANSDDPGSKTNGGDLGFFGKGMMVPEFEKTAFETAPGQVSAPVKTQFGYHIIKVEEKRAAEPADFANAKSRIEQEYIMRERSRMVQQKLEDLRKSKVEFKVAELKSPMMGPPGVM